MKKRLKIKVLEYIILTTISISLIVIIFFISNILNDKTETSNSNEIKNYSITKIIKYTKNSNSSVIYNTPLPESINYEESTYNNYIMSTDNTITNLIETISLTYLNLSIEEKNEILNYCNAYDSIEDQYTLQCQFKNNTLFIKNNFSINKIPTEFIKTKNIEIFIPIKKGTKLNNFLEELTSQNIAYIIVDKIE